MATEEPQFEQLVQEGNFEIRKYSEVTVAETVLRGNMDTASRNGFTLIANYIFGDNHKSVNLEQEVSEKIAMTAPVIAEPKVNSDTIPMTTSVSSGELSTTQLMEEANL